MDAQTSNNATWAGVGPATARDVAVETSQLLVLLARLPGGPDAREECAASGRRCAAAALALDDARRGRAPDDDVARAVGEALAATEAGLRVATSVLRGP